MLLNILPFLILSYNAIIVSGDCPKSREWRNMRISPSGPLVCARLYGDEKCSGFPLPFGINSSTSDLGTESSSAIDFVRNNVTALVRPGCNMFLWEGANFTGRLKKSTNHTWHLDRRHYSSALCNCSVNDVELLQCELREEWVMVNICDFRESDVGGLCSVALKRSYIMDDEDERNVTITENLASLFADKIIESFGEKRMAAFLDVSSNDKLAHSLWVGARTVINITQRSYLCGKYHFFTPEVVKHVRKGTENVVLDKWIYNEITKTYFWFSSTKETRSAAHNKCEQMGGGLARFYTSELRNWMKPLFSTDPGSDWWIYGRNEGHDCTAIDYDDTGSTVFERAWRSEVCKNISDNYICERKYDV